MQPWPVLDEPQIGETIDVASPLSISATTVDIRRDARDFTSEFNDKRAFAFADLLDPILTGQILGACDRARFVPVKTDREDHRLVEEPRVAGAAISLTLQRPAVLRWLEAATGCGPLVGAYGSVLRVPADGRSSLWWHDDLGTDASRRLGVTIYLGGAPYVGGLFELREKTGKLLMRHCHTRVASALIFDVAPHIEHRLSPITAGGPRQVFTGWFTRAV